MAQLTNIDRHAYIDKSGTTTPKYVRIGEGVTSMAPSNNPITDTKHYINYKNSTTKVLGFGKQWALTMERYAGDDANDFIAGLSEKTGEEVVTNLVIVEHHDSAAVTAKPATRYEVTVVVGGEGAITGGAAMDMDVTIYANGDGVVGTFNETTKAFTAS
jgi:hypothetical protein